MEKARQTRARRWCLGCVFYSLMHHYVALHVEEAPVTLPLTGARSANVFA
ncbi:hypothetical protein [Brotaphodocola sp.]